MYLCCYTVSCVRSLLAYGYENIAFQARALFPLGTVYFIKNLNQKVKKEEFSYCSFSINQSLNSPARARLTIIRSGVGTERFTDSFPPNQMAKSVTERCDTIY